VSGEKDQQWFCEVEDISRLKNQEKSVAFRVNWFWSRQDIMTTQYADLKLLGPVSDGVKTTTRNLTTSMGNGELLLIRGHTNLITSDCINGE
jgi:hypothetical protein